MTTLDAILDAGRQQMSLDDLLDAIAQEETETTPIVSTSTFVEVESHDGNGFTPGQSVGHVDFADFRAIYLRPGSRPDKALVKIVTGWHGEHVPVWPVTIPTAKLTEV